MKPTALLIVLLVWPAAPAGAGFDEGLLAYMSGDFRAARREWRPLAEQGLAEAQYQLGVMYGEGQGVPRDDAEAARWFRRAAEQGLVEAQFNLGLMYHRGEGVPADDAEAVKWYRAAAWKGYAAAQEGLGFMYAAGSGLPKDHVLAHMWLDLAAAGSPPGRRHHARLTARDLLAGAMTPSEIADARRLAREWTPRSE